LYERAQGALREDNNVAARTLTSAIGLYADLAVSNITVQGNPAAGQPVTVSWTVTNHGTREATGAWSEQLLLSGDAVAGNDTVLRTDFVQGQSIPANGGAVTRTAQVVLPAFAEGQRWFVVRVDAANAVFELDETNNATVDDVSVSVASSLTFTLGTAAVSEAAGANATTGTVTRSGNTAQALTVTLASSSGEVGVPATVTIPAGASSVTFNIGVIDNTLVQAARTATLSASAAGYAAGQATLGITEDDTPALSVVLAAPAASEGQGQLMATISRNTPADAPMTVQLSIDKAWKATVPATVVIPAGQMSVQVPVTLIDDILIEGTRDVRLTAQAAGHASASALVTVIDNDVPNLSLALSQLVVSEGAGAGATFLTITRDLASSQPLEVILRGDPSQVRFPNRVLIAAGQQSVTVPIAVENNTQADGGRVVAIRVDIADGQLSVPVPGTGQQIALQVTDDDGPSLSLALELAGDRGGRARRSRRSAAIRPPRRRCWSRWPAATAPRRQFRRRC
jgi:hypothetical protein